MSKIYTMVHRSYSFCCRHYLKTASLDMLINIFKSTSKDETAILEGRVAPRFEVLPEAGPVVIKAYKRGGLISRINNDRYLKIGQIRSRREFEFLIAAKKAGVRVPDPVAYANTGFPFYKTWLITKEIKDHSSFVILCRKNKEKAQALIPEISNNINILINNKIHHVDLHPGNILMDGNNNIYIIDFDKACLCLKNKARLAIAYQQRWSRAVHKYKMPEDLAALELG
ncbi:lipopolysaccharide kinase InaA family protein [Desulfobacula phenolica]|uniref:3-deoxy-D-manno-octulosonic acid kinase n=1 Tax=Desulfobacula phenolica TaxID=90732 RepID=A0A1H2DPB4_9BACT|nr:lipopolysaccharide kinase InaA family protein [Desulfobacula phenolica]SDT84208.1 3-deoxy-D-manno-octulosonic acid kinase [Desulfobacula phenolica]